MIEAKSGSTIVPSCLREDDRQRNDDNARGHKIAKSPR